MSETILWVIIALLVLLLGGSLYFLLKVARIIFLVEDTLGEALDDLTKVENTLTRYLTMRVFYDSPVLRPILEEAKGDVMLAKASMTKVAERLTRLSKQKYIVEEPDQGLENLDPKTADLVRDFPDQTEPVPPEEILRDQLERAQGYTR